MTIRTKDLWLAPGYVVKSLVMGLKEVIMGKEKPSEAMVSCQGSMRHGDVVVVLRKGLEPAKGMVPGAPILAYGEVTGHAHRVMVADPAEVDKLESYLLEHSDKSPEWKAAHNPITETGITPRVPTPEEAQVFVDEATQEVKMLMVKASKAILTHEEHWPHILPQGTMEVIKQREYHPQANHYVLD